MNKEVIMKLKKTFIVAVSCITFMMAAGLGNRKNRPSKRKITSIQINEFAPINTHTEHAMPTITVWIHGTRVLPDFTCRNFFYTPPTFTHIEDIEPKYQIRKIADRLIMRDPKRFNHDHFYIFGWSGKASFTARKEEAKNLYDELIKLAESYNKKYGVKPKVRIITHSHGGNLALNLAAIKEKNPPFSIGELILLACPVQEATKNYIADPLFERCYSLFSKVDILQVIDPQGLYKSQGGLARKPLFSKRIFPGHSKLSQAQIRMHGRSIWHIEFIFRRFISNLPSILDAIDEQKKNNTGAKTSEEKQRIFLINVRSKRRTIST